MNVNLEINKDEDDDIEGSIKEFLEEGLQKILSKITSESCNLISNPSFLLSEAYRLSERIEKEKLGVSDFHNLFEETKNNVGTYHEASITLAIVYGIHSLKRDLHWANQQLMEKISMRYRFRPWMYDVLLLVNKLKVKYNHTNYIKQLNNELLSGDKTVVINIGNDASINLYSPGNFIGKTIKYGK